MEQFNYIILDIMDSTWLERQSYINSGKYTIVYIDSKELILKRKEINKK